MEQQIIGPKSITHLSGTNNLFDFSINAENKKQFQVGTLLEANIAPETLALVQMSLSAINGLEWVSLVL